MGRVDLGGQWRAVGALLKKRRNIVLWMHRTACGESQVSELSGFYSVLFRSLSAVLVVK